jgi:hypothetical protein
MDGRADRRIGIACGAIALLTAVAAAAGVFARGDGSSILVRSERGVSYEMATSGVYANNAQRVVAEGIGWDVFTLLVIVPALVAAAVFVARGTLRARLTTLGLLTYLVYMYLEYAVTWAFGPAFLLHVAIYALSFVTACAVAGRVASAGLDGRLAEIPRRSWVALNVGMASLLTMLWLGRIGGALGGDLASAGLTSETTLTVQALDLGLVVPVSLMSAWLVWRRASIGPVVAAVWSITFILMATAIVAMLASAAILEGALELPPMVIFGTAATAAAWIARRIYTTAPRGTLEGRHLRPATTQARPAG